MTTARACRARINPAPPDTAHLAALVGALALVGARLVLVAAGEGSTVGGLIPLFAALVALAAALSAWRTDGTPSIPWSGVAAGCAAWAIGRPVRIDDPFVAHVVLNVVYVVMVAAFAVVVVRVGGVGDRRAAHAKLAADLMPPVIVVATVTWLFLTGPFVLDTASGNGLRLTAVVHGLGCAALLTLALAGLLGPRRADATFEERLVVSSICAVALADGLWLQHLVGTLSAGETLATAGLVLGFAGLLAAALLAQLRPLGAASAPAAERAAAIWESQVPNLSLAAMLALAVGQAVLGEPVRFGLAVTLLGALGMVLLVVARQAMILRRDRSLRAEIGELSERIDGLMQQVGRDPLTGLLNHRAVHERLDHELANGRVNGTPVAIVLIDVDNFKTVNDTLGHQAGDRVLRAVAGILTAASRGSDVAARYAGDEFMLVLPGLDEANAGHVCGRIADEVRRINRDLDLGDAVRVSLSVGVAVTHRCQRSVAQTVAIADAAMYDAKESGKDQVVVVNADTLVIADARDAGGTVDAMVAASRTPAAALLLPERRRAG